MRILLANKFLYPKGGAEIVCLGLKDDLEAAGHETVLFGMADPRNVAHADSDCEVPAVDYHADRGLGRKLGEALRTVYNRGAAARMATLLDRTRPDLVHLHNIYHQLTPSILGPCAAREIPVVLTLHDYKLACPVYTFLRDGRPCEDCLGRHPLPVLRHRCKGGSLAESAVLYAEAVTHRLLRSYAKGVDRYSAPSRFLRDKMLAAGVPPKRIVHLRNALPLPAASVAAAYAPPPERETPEILWVGRLSAEKGLPTLLEALARLGGGLRLLLVGDGPEQEALERQAGELALGDALRFLGRQPRERIPELVASADATVIPSEWYENAPLSILESLALGRPVVGTRIGGIPEMIVPGETGWLCEPGDPEALAAALADCAGDAAERRRRGARAHALARQDHHPDLVLARTLELYRSLLPVAQQA